MHLWLSSAFTSDAETFQSNKQRDSSSRRKRTSLQLFKRGTSKLQRTRTEAEKVTSLWIPSINTCPAPKWSAPVSAQESAGTDTWQQYGMREKAAQILALLGLYQVKDSNFGLPFSKWKIALHALLLDYSNARLLQISLLKLLIAGYCMYFSSFKVKGFCR